MSRLFFAIRVALGAFCLVMICGWTFLYLMVEPR